MAAKNRIDFTGKRIGDWQIKELKEVLKPDARHREVVWSATCLRCGCDKTVTTGSLRAGSTRCFDCREIGYKDPQEASYKKLYRKAKQKNRTLKEKNHVKYSEFKKLMKQNCHYCGVEPSNSYGVRSPGMTPARNTASEIVYSGLDRVDNAKGYIDGNLVPCCARCNKAKSDRSFNEVLEWAERLVNYQKSLK